MVPGVVRCVCDAREIVEFSEDALSVKARGPFGGLEFEVVESLSVLAPRPVCS